MSNLEYLRYIVDIIAIITGIVVLYKIKEYRQFKQWMQFDIDANIYKLNTSTKEMKPFILEKDGTEGKTQPEKHTHAVEVVLKFTNKGKMRLRIYNIQTKISTMPKEDVRRGEDGHLSLCTIFNSGNIVSETIKFYYIEPQVEQVITFLALITEPQELIRVAGKFSLEQERIFPDKDVSPKYPFPRKQICKLFPCLEKCVALKGLLPHMAVRTYQLDSEGYVKI